MFKWTAEIEVDETWIADGFELTAEDLKNAILEHMLGYADDSEVNVEIVKSPSEDEIREAQGY